MCRLADVVGFGISYSFGSENHEFDRETKLDPDKQAYAAPRLKKIYVAPQLTEHGSVAQLTGSVLNSSSQNRVNKPLIIPRSDTVVPGGKKIGNSHVPLIVKDLAAPDAKSSGTDRVPSVGGDRVPLILKKDAGTQDNDQPQKTAPASEDNKAQEVPPASPTADDEAATELALNDIGRVRLRTQAPLLYDEYRRNRATGSFILVDEATHTTVGAGMILAPLGE